MPWDDHRPMSPHLQVYKLPLAAKLSIFHRATGAVLFFGFILITVTLASAMFGRESWAIAQTILSSVFGYIVLIGFSFSLYYHLCNGIRHLFWDAGYGFDPEHTRKSGIAVIILSTLLTAATWLIAFF